MPLPILYGVWHTCLCVSCVGPLWGLCASCVGPLWGPPLRWLASFGCPPPVLTDSLQAARCSSFHALACPCGPILAMVPRPVHAVGGGLRAPSTALLAAAQRSSGQAAADMRSAAPRDCLLSGAAVAGATGRDGDSGIRACTAPPDSRAGAPSTYRPAGHSRFLHRDISDTQSAEPTDWTRLIRRRAVRHKINAPRLAAISSLRPLMRPTLTSRPAALARPPSPTSALRSRSWTSRTPSPTAVPPYLLSNVPSTLGRSYVRRSAAMRRTTSMPSTARPLLTRPGGRSCTSSTTSSPQSPGRSRSTPSLSAHALRLLSLRCPAPPSLPSRRRRAPSPSARLSSLARATSSTPPLRRELRPRWTSTSATGSARRTRPASCASPRAPALHCQGLLPERDAGGARGPVGAGP